MPALPTLITSASNPISTGLANWFTNDASSTKQSLITGAKELAMRGQAALADERIQTHVQAAQNVADSVTVWYTELEPGYLARFAQWAARFVQWAARFAQWVGDMFAQWAGDMFAGLAGWFLGPQALKLFIIWVSIVVIVHIIISVAGFGPAGVLAGSLAAGFQAWAYGAFTPAGGVFAFLTSMGMLGLMQPVGLAVGVELATIVVAICFAAGVGA